MIKKLLRRAASLKQNVQAYFALHRLNDGDYRVEGVPYECQFASPERVRAILEDGTDDPEWRRFGYETKKEATYWAPRQCAVACVKMVLNHHGKEATVAALTKRGVELGGYDTVRDTGWYYKPLVELMEEYGIRSRVVPMLSINAVAVNVAGGKLVIASVNPEIIRGDNEVKSRTKSGHLVVVIGCKKQQGKLVGFYIHNPSGKSDAMRANAYISLARFQESFGERGIVTE